MVDDSSANEVNRHNDQCTLEDGAYLHDTGSCRDGAHNLVTFHMACHKTILAYHNDVSA